MNRWSLDARSKGPPAPPLLAGKEEEALGCVPARRHPKVRECMESLSVDALGCGRQNYTER